MDTCSLQMHLFTLKYELAHSYQCREKEKMKCNRGVKRKEKREKKER